MQKYWNRYKNAGSGIRTFFWTVVLFSLIIVLSTVWAYVRLYSARTQIAPPPDMKPTVLQVVH